MRPPTNDLSRRCGPFALGADLMCGCSVAIRLIASRADLL